MKGPIHYDRNVRHHTMGWVCGVLPSLHIGCAVYLRGLAVDYGVHMRASYPRPTVRFVLGALRALRVYRVSRELSAPTHGVLVLPLGVFSGSPACATSTAATMRRRSCGSCKDWGQW
jgi:hypothetical protein